jgi:hypothetical protein
MHDNLGWPNALGGVCVDALCRSIGGKQSFTDTKDTQISGKTRLVPKTVDCTETCDGYCGSQSFTLITIFYVVTIPDI